MRLSAIGTTIDNGVIVCFRVAGAVILRLFVLLTQLGFVDFYAA